MKNLVLTLTMLLLSIVSYTSAHPTACQGDHCYTEKERQYISCPEQVNDTLPFRFDCRAFINCNNGQPNLQYCPQGTLYNYESQQCTQSDNVVNCIYNTHTNRLEHALDTEAQYDEEYDEFLDEGSNFEQQNSNGTEKESKTMSGAEVPNEQKHDIEINVDIDGQGHVLGNINVGGQEKAVSSINLNKDDGKLKQQIVNNVNVQKKNSGKVNVNVNIGNKNVQVPFDNNGTEAQGNTTEQRNADQKISQVGNNINIEGLGRQIGSSVNVNQGQSGNIYINVNIGNTGNEQVDNNSRLKTKSINKKEKQEDSDDSDNVGQVGNGSDIGGFNDRILWRQQVLNNENQQQINKRVLEQLFINNYNMQQLLNDYNVQELQPLKIRFIGGDNIYGQQQFGTIEDDDNSNEQLIGTVEGEDVNERRIQADEALIDVLTSLFENGETR